MLFKLPKSDFQKISFKGKHASSSLREPVYQFIAILKTFINKLDAVKRKYMLVI